MVEAVELNQERKSLYMEATEGRAEEICDLLIKMPADMIAIAEDFDRQARPYQDQGIALMCEEFMPISNTPDFSASSAISPHPLDSFIETNSGAVVNEFYQVYESEGFSGLDSLASRYIDQLADLPEYHCMFRHLLESIRRAAQLAPIHDAAALVIGLDSTLELSWYFIQIQVVGFHFAANIDRLAAPLQAEGLPIVCQDVPFIPEIDQ
jgi:hypothetical protein